MYLPSDKINVFPSTKRGGYQRSARLISESNLINIINKLVDKDAFVITPFNNSLTPSTRLEFIIYGYYFNIETASLTQSSDFSSATNIYANIELATSDGYTTLNGQDTFDTNSTYNGVTFSDSANTGSSWHSLNLLTRNSSADQWTIPLDSTVKYALNKMGGSIDGGTI